MKTRAVLSGSRAVLGMVITLLAARPAFSQSQMEGVRPRHWELGAMVIPSAQGYLAVGSWEGEGLLYNGAALIACRSLSPHVYLFSGVRYREEGNMRRVEGTWRGHPVDKYVNRLATVNLCLGGGIRHPLGSRMEIKSELLVMRGIHLRNVSTLSFEGERVHTHSFPTPFPDLNDYQAAVAAGVRAHLQPRWHLDIMPMMELGFNRYEYEFENMGLGLQVGAFWVL